MTAAATEASLVYCTRCSRTTDEEMPDVKGWFLSPKHPVIVQGKTLGLCPSCAIGEAPPAEADEAAICGGSCGGAYRPATGTYYLGRQHTTGIAGDEWSCWDLSCVESWADEYGECPECGHDLDITIRRYVDGIVMPTLTPEGGGR